MLRLLGRYVFREIFASAVLGTLLATFVLFLRGVDQIFELLVKSNTASTSLVLELFALAIPSVLPLTIPVRRVGRDPDRSWDAWPPTAKLPPCGQSASAAAR